MLLGLDEGITTKKSQINMLKNVVVSAYDELARIYGPKVAARRMAMKVFSAVDTDDEVIQEVRALTCVVQ